MEAISRSCLPEAAARTKRQRKATCCGVLGAASHRTTCSRSSAAKLTSGLLLAMRTYISYWPQYVYLFMIHTTSVLTLERYNGITQSQYVVTNPDFFPTIPAGSSLASGGSQRATERLGPNLRAPYLMQSAVSVERQIPSHTTIAVTYVNSHGPNQFLTNDINAPLPGTYNP